MTFKPMLASPANLDTLRWPKLASPKLDGIRAAVVGGKLLSRSLKPIPNRFISDMLSDPQLNGFDGELIIGPPTAKDVYLQSVSGVMRQEGTPDFIYHLFDLHDMPGAGYSKRLTQLQADVGGFGAREMFYIRQRVVRQDVIRNLDEFHVYEAKVIEEGYEGVMLRDPEGVYKFGRSTANEELLLKVKRFADSEAEIIGIEEEMFNGNAAETNELGRTKRSTAKAGLVGKGTMGALRVRDIHRGWEFCIGTGFTADQRAQPWKIGTVHKYKYFPIGMKDVPRHPVYIGPRSKLDL